MSSPGPMEKSGALGGPRRRAGPTPSTVRRTSRVELALAIISAATWFCLIAGLHKHPWSPLAGGKVKHDSYFYGQSPPIYPSPPMTGIDGWEEAFEKARDMVARMTLEEKLLLTAGAPKEGVNRCDGNITPVPRVGFNGICLADAGQGYRGTDFVSSWPSGIHVGASFNRDLTFKRAFGMGSEFGRKGANMLLGPVVGPLGRTVRGGRNWEGFAVDPYLSGVLVDATVRGIQQAGVIASTKHYIANEQETNRQMGGGLEAVSSNIDDRTMHELYLWPFQDAVRAGTGSIMCSYNRLNNSYASANSKLLNGLLKKDLGFQGNVVSDWGAQHAGVASANAGLDLAMPHADGFWGSELAAAVRNGSVAESRLDDMAMRVLSPWFRLGQHRNFPAPGSGSPANINTPHRIVDARTPSNKQILFDGAVEGHVLVKNTRNTLPLNKPKMLALYGYSAKKPGAYHHREGMFNAGEERPFALVDTLFSGGGSGATSVSTVSAPFDAISQECWEDDTAMYWDFVKERPEVNTNADVCLVFGNAWAEEGYDRAALRDDHTDGLVKHVASSCNKTVVILHNAGPRLVDQFIDHPNVTAVIFAHLPGQASGIALTSILYGKVNPSGKLPYTLARNESEYGGLQNPNLPEGRYARFPQADFTEGVFIDYRRFDATNTTPRYEFGFGLSYTTFSYNSLRIDKISSSDASWYLYPDGPVLLGGQADLWDELVRVSADVSNAGDVGGAEAAQLYLGLPGAGEVGSGVPARQLRGVDKRFIAVGETATVEFALTRRDLSVWDVVAQKWMLQRGEYTVYVGGSSRSLPLKGTFSV